jgi:hypothetical protein
MSVYNQGDPRQKIQLCVNCGDSTERCEDDALFITVTTPDDLAGPFCDVCFDHSKPWVTEGHSNG